MKSMTVITVEEASDFTVITNAEERGEFEGYAYDVYGRDGRCIGGGFVYDLGQGGDGLAVALGRRVAETHLAKKAGGE